MGWLEDVIAALQPSAERLASPAPWEHRSGDVVYPGGGDPMAAAPYAAAPVPFAIGSDPMTAGGPVPNGPGLPQPAINLPPSMTYPTRQAVPGFIDYASGGFAPGVGPNSPFGDIPPVAPPPPPQMQPQTAVAGLNSPMGGGGAPFSMAPGLPPSIQLASAMAKPPPPDPTKQQPSVMPGGGLPGPVQPPAMAAGGGEGAPTDISAARRGADPMSMAPEMPAAPETSLMDKFKGFGDKLRELSPNVIALGAGMTGEGWDKAAQVNLLQQKQREGLQQANVTAQALLKKGAPLEDIQAAMKSPEMLKALIGQYYAKDKGVKLEKFKDASGREVAAWVDPDNKTILPAKVPGMPDAGEQATLNEAQHARVKAIVEGREPYPSPNTRSGDAQMIREAVHAADPSFDAVNYKSREATRKNFTAGKAAANLTAFNTAIGHLGTLNSSIDELNNSGIPAWNKYVANPVAEQLDPKYQTAIKKFETARTAVADELTRAFRGSGGNVHDIIQWEKAINAADSPAALKAAVRQAAELLGSRITSIGDEYNRGMGTTKDPLELLNPKSSAAFQKMLEGERSGATAVQKKGSVTIGGQSIPWSLN